jgi:hypothetical protein
VRQALPEGERREHVEKSTALLSVLAKAKTKAWQFVITGDEAWFFYDMPHSKIWVPPDADAPEVAKRLINTPKTIMTIFWNPSGIHFLAALLEKALFDAEYFLDYEMIQIQGLSAMHAAAILRQTLVIYMNNSSMHNSKAAIQKIASMRVKIAPHPHSLPDFASSDSFLFG